MIRYKLDDLGWFQFEWLCQSLLKNRCGLSVEAWGGSGDHGRDAYCPVDLEFPQRGKVEEGPFVFQAKFVQEANAAGAKPAPLLNKAVDKECKLLKLQASGRNVSTVRHYVLLTNVSLDSDLRDGVSSKLRAVLPKAKITALGGGDLCNMLDDAPNIRTAFPQLLGIADIDLLINNAILKPVLERSKFAIRRAHDLARVFVPTSAYNKAQQVLTNHWFVALTGPPEMGKTTIAKLIALGKFGEGWEVYECKRPEDMLRAFNPASRQLFVADDLFGSTEFRPDLAQDWGADLDQILGSLDKTHWFVLTCRRAILEIALKRINRQGAASKFPEPAQVIVAADDLTELEKTLILYRHAKAAGLEELGRQVVKIFARDIIENQHFTPERVRRFLLERLASVVVEFKKGQPNPLREWEKRNSISAAIRKEMETPTEGMRKSFDALSEQYQQVLIALIDAEDGQMTEEMLKSTFARLWGDTVSHDPISVANDLLSHFLRIE